MHLYSEALGTIRKIGAKAYREHEICTLEDACDRVLATEIICPENNPSFDNSAMDGFALPASLTAQASVGNLVTVPIYQTLGAGETAVGDIPVGVAVEIMTGAEIPAKHLDTVVRVEDVQVVESKGSRQLVFAAPVLPMMNIRPRGSDLKTGDSLLNAGTQIGPHQMMALATFGITQVPVLRRPLVVVISTGKELVDYRSTPPGRGQIRNSTAPFIVKSLERLGCRVQFMGIVDDDLRSLDRAFGNAFAERPDMVISTGGVSVGRYDWVEHVLKGHGVEVHFHKCAIRPGKPILFGSLEGTQVFGIPGNPISSAVAIRFFVTPFLRSLMGLGDERPQLAAIQRDIKKPEGLRCFFRSISQFKDNVGFVEVLTGQESYRLRSSLQANSWAVLPEHGEIVTEGTLVEVFSLEGDLKEGTIG
jgi:molybdopterin molybdotransferase